jgi:tRNA threonylcarbamoyladenosine biosynthesis protein TsaE
MLAPLHVHLSDEQATRRFGERLAAVMQTGMSVHLSGDLGSGKTTLARGVLRGLGFAGKVKSPTYTLVEPYIDSRLTLYHFDFFRFREPSEWRDTGFRECFSEHSICLVEWPEKAAAGCRRRISGFARDTAGRRRDALSRRRRRSGADA